MAFDRIRDFLQSRRGDRPSRAAAEATMTREEKSFADVSVEDQAADRAAAEHLGGIDPGLPPDRDEP